MLILDVYDIRRIIDKVGFKDFYNQLIDTLEEDYKNWDNFDKMARVATHFSYGVIELMPTSDEEFYAYKYVTGHPQNPNFNKTTVMATGQLSTIDTGYVKMVIGEEKLYAVVINGVVEHQDNTINVIAQEAEVGLDEDKAMAHLETVRAERLAENKRRNVDFAKAERELKKSVKEGKAGQL